MMEIEISTNLLNDIFGERKKINIPQNDSIRLKELFDLWAQKGGRKVLERLLDGDNLRPEIILLVNERSVESLDGLETEICDGDRLVILTAITGG